ncbi:MAG TPA: LysR family transcriptional regulator [bacterium]|nr:LysR family transcriptional regulator [bacterium]
MLDNISELRLFVRSAALGSLAAAGRELGLSPAAVSKRIASLEARLGTRLLHRTTRRLRLTEDGAGFYERCLRILADLDEAEAAISERDLMPRGTLKVTVPLSFGRRHMGEAVAEFLARNPQVRVELELSDSLVDIVEEGYDLAVRLTVLKDSSLIARRLLPNHRVVCAAPAYLERHGAPRTPTDLATHNCLIHGTEDVWEFEGPEGPLPVKVAGSLVTNSGQVLKDTVLAGLGLAVKSTWDISAELETGRLRTVLADWPVFSRMAFYLLYPSGKQLSPKVRAFADFLVERFGRGDIYPIPAPMARPRRATGG